MVDWGFCFVPKSAMFAYMIAMKRPQDLLAGIAMIAPTEIAINVLARPTQSQWLLLN